MHKKISICIAVLMLLCSFSLCFATEEATLTDEEVIPAFVEVNGVTSEISVTGGNAKYSVTVMPNIPNEISYINATLKLVNSSGTVLKTKTDKIYFSGGLFKLSDTKSSIAKGTYHAEYTLKVYKSGKLIETINGKSVSKKY